MQKYDLSENEIWGLGIGCKGELEMLILPINKTDSFWRKVEEVTLKEQVFTLVLEVPSGRSHKKRNHMYEEPNTS
jgi:xanthine dehydrogenase accessory factor